MKKNAAQISMLLIAVALLAPAVQAALVVDAGDDLSVLAGEPVTVLAACNDTDGIDLLNLSAFIDWGTVRMPAEILADDEQNATIQATHRYPVAGIYTVTVAVENNATGNVTTDSLNVTVNPQTAAVGVAPGVLNQKSRGLMTVFVSVSEWLGFAEADEANVTIADPSIFTIGNATPAKVNYCMRDGGTFILKYRRADVAPLAAEGNLTVNGSAVTEDGNVTVIGRGAVSLIEPGNGKGPSPGNPEGHPLAERVKERTKNENAFRDRERSSGTRSN
jgi:hypothetical protein